MDFLMALGLLLWIGSRVRKWWRQSSVRKLAIRLSGGSDVPACFVSQSAGRGARRLGFDWNGTQIEFDQFRDYGRYEYTARDRRHHFVFDLQPVGEEVRIYIVEQPPYPRGRATDTHSTHRIEPDSARPWVCVLDAEKPTNVPDAVSWMIYWAERTADYIRTGRAFS